MKISAILPNFIKTSILSTTIGISPTNISAQDFTSRDTFEYKQIVLDEKELLAKAPSPRVLLKGKEVNVTLLADLSKNLLFQYDSQGKPERVFPVASGKQSSPTTKGLRIISHVESFPYKNAPKTCKRRKTPNVYGANVIIVEALDQKTGVKSATSQFLHGTNNPSSIGKYASAGCVRMYKKDIQYLAKLVKHGNLYLIK